MEVEEILRRLRRKASPRNVRGMARFGMSTRGRLGVSVPEMRRIARSAGKDHRLALALWKTGIAEARIVASMVAEPGKVTARQMDTWVVGINSWDICDQVCGNLWDKTPFAWSKARSWTRRDEEFVRRAGFALIACLAWHDKQAPDARFIAVLPLIERGASDERNFVKKAVSWVLRAIGKRNRGLRTEALRLAKKLKGSDSRAARWIGADVSRELGATAGAGRRRTARPKAGRSSPPKQGA
jgi:3-methyladenine DNA glycosylase AlkD